MSTQTPVPPGASPAGERGPRRRRWWLIALIAALAVVAAVVIGVFAWMNSMQACSKAEDPTRSGAASEYCPAEPYRPNGAAMTVGPDGKLWYVDSNNKIARFTPQTGAVTEFAAPTAPNAVAGGGLARGADGNIWYIANDQLGRVSMSGAFEQFALPKDKGLAQAMAVSPDGTFLWVAMTRDTPYEPVTLLKIPVPSDASQTPVPIEVSLPANVTLGPMAAGPDGSLWMATARMVTASTILTRITPSGAITQFPLNIPGPAPSCGTDCKFVAGLTAGADGNMWFADGWGHIGKITPAGVATFYRASEVGDVYGRGYVPMSAGPDGNIWFSTSDGSVARITPAGVVTKFSLPQSGGGSAITAGPDGGVWFQQTWSQPPAPSARFVRVTP